jgi:hypothetical protein
MGVFNTIVRIPLWKTGKKRSDLRGIQARRSRVFGGFFSMFALQSRLTSSVVSTELNNSLRKSESLNKLY